MFFSFLFRFPSLCWNSHWDYWLILWVHWTSGFWTLYLGDCLPMSVSMYYVDLLCLPVLAEWHYIGDFLRDPLVHSPWYLSLGSKDVRCVGCVCSFVVGEPWCWHVSGWDWPTLRVTGCEDWSWQYWKTCHVGLTPWSRICFNRALVLAESTL